MIRLLCISGDIYPPKTGGDQAVFNAYFLLQKYLDLHIFVIGRDGEEATTAKYKKALPDAKIGYFNPNCKDRYEFIHQVTLRLKKLLQKIFNVETEAAQRELQLTVNLERNANLYAAINQYVRNNAIDIVQFEFASSLFWGEGIVEPVKKVFVQHEIQYVVKAQRLSRNDENARMKWGIEKNREIAMMNAYDAIITLSGDDRNRLISDGVTTPIYASFAKVQIRQNIRIDYQKVDRIDLVFVGPESHIPNRHGMSWFLKEAWPAILSMNPDTQLHIVGNWSSDTIRKWTSIYRNIYFDGFVDNLILSLQKRVMIVPIFEGSGIRMKILEAANAGVPFVACSIGAEGLGFENGKNCFIADDGKIFADKVNTLLSDKKLLQRFSNAAYEHITATFSDERFIQSRMQCYEDVYGGIARHI